MLLHYPACFPGANCIPDPSQSWQESWGVLESLVGQGKVRSIGGSRGRGTEICFCFCFCRVGRRRGGHGNNNL